MRIDFSEPECSTCFHCRTSGVLNPRVPEPPSNVIASPVTSTPVSSEPVHDSAASAVASTSTSSPAKAQAFGHHSAADVASTSTSSSPAHSSSPHGSVRFSFGPDSSAPTQAHGFTTSDSMQAPDSSAAPTPSIFGEIQATGVVFGGPEPSTSVFSFGGASDTATPSPPFNFSPFGSHTPPSLLSAQAPSFGSGLFAAPTPSPFGSSTQAPSFGSNGFAAPTPSPFGSSKQAPSFGFGSSLFAAPTPSPFGRSTEAPAFGSSGFAAPIPSPFGRSEQVPAFGYGSGVASATSTSSTSGFSPQDLGKTAPPPPPPSLFRNGPPPPSLFRNGVGCFARRDVATSPAVNTSSTTVVFGTTPVSVSSSVGATTGFVVTPSTTQKSPFTSLFPGFGDDYLPGTPPFNVFRVNPPSSTPVSGFGPVTSGVNQFSSQPSGFSAFSSNHNTGSPVIPTHQWDVRERGTGNPRYAPTPCTDPTSGGNMISISASFSYQDKSHDELRWEDYKKGVKGRSLPPASSPASGCTACGATSSSSASGNLGFNVPTTPPSATPGACPTMNGTTTTTTAPVFQAYAMMMPMMYPAMHPMMMYGTSLAAQGTRTAPALQVYPTMFGANLAAAQGTTPAPLQAYPTMFGTNVAAQGTTTTSGLQAYPMMYGTNPAVQVATPSGQAYPVHGLILLPFAAMNLQ